MKAKRWNRKNDARVENVPELAGGHEAAANLRSFLIPCGRCFFCELGMDSMCENTTPMAGIAEFGIFAMCENSNPITSIAQFEITSMCENENPISSIAEFGITSMGENTGIASKAN